MDVYKTFYKNKKDFFISQGYYVRDLRILRTHFCVSKYTLDMIDSSAEFELKWLGGVLVWLFDS